jgi:hypothetical protein
MRVQIMMAVIVMLIVAVGAVAFLNIAPPGPGRSQGANETASGGQSSQSTTQATSGGSQTPVGRPVDVVSVKGPVPPYNPGGTVISITLENIGGVPVSFLNASLDFRERVFPYPFVFNVSSSHPLLPSQSVQATQTLIGAGFQSGVQYPLTISGALADGTRFSYTVEAQISAP